MSKKKYPWKTRYAPLSHRGHKEGRKPRNFAEEEHLARCVYDDLLRESPHEHIADPCHGLDPKKVREGRGGSEAYRRTARALMNKTHLCAYIGEDGLTLKTDTELVPLLRQCTAPTDGLIDWPKFVRHIVGLYYIMHVDPRWLFAQLPLDSCSENQRDAPHYMCDILAFYLFKPRAIRCADYTRPITLDEMKDYQIFALVNKKLRHIIQSIKDDGDRAQWTLYKGTHQRGEEASRANLRRLYGGDLDRKLECKALNHLRNAGRLNMVTLEPGEVNKQRIRVMKLHKVEKQQDVACAESARIAGLITHYERALDDACGDEAAVQKAEKKLAGLKKWQNRNARTVEKLSRQQRISERWVADGEIPFFHKLEDLKARNIDAVNAYIRENTFRLRYHADMGTLLAKNFEAGTAGKSSSGVASHVFDNRQFLPHGGTTFHSVILLGAFSAGLRELPVSGKSFLDPDENVPLARYAELKREAIREELAQHGFIRCFVLQMLAMYRERQSEIVNQAKEYYAEKEEILSKILRHAPYEQALSLMGVGSEDEIVKLGKDYFQRSRHLYKELCRFHVLSSDEIEQVRAAYRSVHELCCGEVVMGEPRTLDALDEMTLRQLYGWDDKDFERAGGRA